MKRIHVAPLCLAGLLPSPALGAIAFEDVTTSSGLSAADSLANQIAADDGWTDTLSWGHRIAWADVTGDGLPDLFVGRMPCVLLANDGDGTFTDVSDASGYRALDDYAHGGVAFDMENDGDRDWFASGNWDVYPSEAEVLAANDGGGNFTSVVHLSTAISGVPGQASSGTRGVGAADFDGDGFLDLVAVTSTSNGAATSDEHVFWNDGTGRYLEATLLDDSFVKNQACQTIDFDHDGDMDIYTNRRSKRNKLFRNDGGRQFVQVAGDVGLALDDGESDDGANFGDVDNDGDLDVVIGGRILANDGAGLFTEIGTYTNGGAYCTGLADLDNDGDLDFVVPRNDASPLVYENDGTGVFTELGPQGLDAVLPDDRRTVAFADFDGDGRLDLGFADKRAGNSLFRNTTPDAGNWIKVQLRRANGQIDAIGSFAYAYPAGSLGDSAALLGLRHAEGATGYSSMNDPVLHFGLGSASSVDLRVVFPGGTVVERIGVPAGQTVAIVEGGGDPTAAEPRIAGGADAVRAFPNPFRSLTTIAFQNQGRAASVHIVDVRGRTVAAFDHVTGESVSWSPRASGVYFVRVRTDRATLSRKITRID